MLFATLRPTVTVPRLATAPELIFKRVEPSLLLLSATFVVAFVKKPPLLTFIKPAWLDMANVPLFITPPLLMLIVSAKLSTNVVVPATLNPAALRLSVTVEEPSASEAMLAADIGES